jgi:hypothetical protein
VAQLDLSKIAEEARSLSQQELDEAMDKAAEGLPEAEINTLIYAGTSDAREIVGRAKTAFDFGRMMFHGFEYQAGQKQAAVQKRASDSKLGAKAPGILAAIS